MKGVNYPKPQHQWIKVMHAQITQWKKDGEMILMADNNSPLESDAIGEFLAKTEMIDLIGHHHVTSTVNSHIRGTQQIDFIFGTKKISDSATEGRILPFHTHITSDR
eukprot:5287345-Ditylum_brightwellii.AAC.1